MDFQLSELQSGEVSDGIVKESKPTAPQLHSKTACSSDPVSLQVYT